MNQENNLFTKHAVKTGTTTLAILCADGIVVAADKRATMGQLIADRASDKIVQIVDNIVVTTAGTASATDRVSKLARAELKLLEVKTNRKVTVKGVTGLKVERKSPLAHAVLGKTTEDNKELSKAMEKFVKALNKSAIAKITIASSMGPVIRVSLIS